jgi:undecaprenyl diphosphate synthase
MKEKPKSKYIPESIGFILDGNRRWAQKNGEGSHKGHESGARKLKKLVGWIQEMGVRYLIVYGFSTENWNRDPKEVRALFDLFRNFFREELPYAQKNGIRIGCIGDVSRFPKDIQDLIQEAEEKTQKNKSLTLILALSYGGRSEIISAIKKLDPKKIKTLTEKEFSRHLWTENIPDPDIIIRTGGNMRLSNFLPWQSVYSEFFFPSVFFPDFTKGHLSSILRTYQKRERRFGV